MNFNIIQIADEIFNKNPQQPNSIQLIIQNVDISIIFEILVLFLFQGIIIKYDNYELNDLFFLDDKDKLYDKIYYKFSEYFNSIGFRIKLNIIDLIPLNYKNKLVFYDKIYPLEFTILLLINYNNNIENIYIDYIPGLISEKLENYYLIIKTNKYSLQINFSYY